MKYDKQEMGGKRRKKAKKREEKRIKVRKRRKITFREESRFNLHHMLMFIGDVASEEIKGLKHRMIH